MYFDVWMYDDNGGRQLHSTHDDYSEAIESLESAQHGMPDKGWALAVGAPESLDGLLELIRAGQWDLSDNLPTYGPAPLGTPSVGVWSWDAKRLLAGTCRDDVRIVTVEDWESENYCE